MISQGDGFYTHFSFRRKSPVITAGLTWNFNNYKPDRRQRDQGIEETEDGGDFGL
jgi:hypothetical protein